MAAAAAIVAAVSWTALKPGSGVDEVALDPHVVAVLPFRVAGADPSLHYLRQGMLDLLQAKLTGEGGPRAADARSVLAAFRDAGGTDENDVAEDGLASIANKVGAGARGAGEHRRSAGSRRARRPRCSRCPGARSMAQTTVEGPKDSLFVMVDRLAAQLLALGAGASQQQLSSLTTTSLDALRAYLDGVSAMRRGAFATSTPILGRAVQLDSTFALALSAYIESNGWVPGSMDLARVARLALQYRDRLNSRDQLILSIRLGSRFPKPTPSTQELTDRERATQLMPDNAEAWYYLGDELFHGGLLADIPNALARSKDAFLRAFQLDSLYGAPAQHLLSVAFAEGDTAAAALWVKRVAALDSSDMSVIRTYRWVTASMRGDAPGLRLQMAMLDSTPVMPRYLLTLFPLDTAVVTNSERIAGVLLRHASSANERRDAIRIRQHALWNAGRPAEAARWVDSLAANGEQPGRVVTQRTSGPTLFGGDWVSPVTYSPAGDDNPSGLFANEITRLARGDVSSVDRTVAALRRSAGSGDAVDEDFLRMAAVLEAWASVSRKSSDASAVVQRADSAVRGWQTNNHIYSLVLGRAWFELGQFDRALTAIRRRYIGLGFPTVNGLPRRCGSRVRSRQRPAIGPERFSRTSVTCC